MALVAGCDMESQSFYAELLRAYFDSTNDAIFVLCDEMKFLACNSVMQNWLGISEEELTRHNRHVPIIDLLASINKDGSFETNFAKAMAGEATRFVTYVQPPRSMPRWIELSMKRVNVEEADMVVAVARDISDRKAYLDVMERQATVDPLTGLINRQVFQQQLSRLILEHDDRHVAVALLDIDRFRDINESLGYPIGDQVLKLVAGRFRDFQSQHNEITIAGLGGDSFGIVMAYQQEADLYARLAQLQRALSKRIETRAGELILDFTTGVALYPDHADHAEDLLHRAESALHSAKTQHKRLLTYQHDHQVGIDHVMLRVDLERAISSDAIKPHYQPIVHHRHGRVRLELLARWQHDSLGMIDPSLFIPLAEYTGLITRLTLSLLKQALAECAPLIHSNRIESLSLNLSPYTLYDISFPDSITRLLSQQRLQPRHLLLELTEGAIIPDSASESKVMKALGKAGFRLAVDDFGTGHSSLVRLKLLPITELKIDKSFVEHAHLNNDDRVIVRTAVSLAHNMNLEVVAEGVSSIEAKQLLSSLGCDYLQGHLFSPPVPAIEMPAILDHIARQYKPGIAGR